MGQAEAKAALIALREGDVSQVGALAMECSALNGSVAFTLAKAALCYLHASGGTQADIDALSNCIRGLSGVDAPAAIADIMVEVAEQIRPLQVRVEVAEAEKVQIAAQLAIANGVMDDQGAEVASLREQVRLLELSSAALQGQIDAFIGE